MKKYDKYIYSAPEFKVEPLTLDKFKKVCIAQAKSAAGLDGWAAVDVALFSDLAFQHIVDLLNCIEEGKMEWPEHLLETRAVLLSKDPLDTSNPLAHRI